MKQSHKTVALYILILLTFWAMYSLWSKPKEEVKDLRFSEFLAQVQSDNVERVTIQGETYQGELRTALPLESGENASVQTRKFKTSGPIESAVVMTALMDHNVDYDFRKKKTNPIWVSALMGWMPILIILVIFFIFMRQIQAGGGKALSFGKSKARLLNEDQTKVTFEDVAGVDEAKLELQEIIDFLKDPRKFTRLGGRIPKGVLLMGPPGTGKTLLARAVAGEAGVPFFSISGSDFVEMFVGVGASRVRDLFDQGKKNAPCIIFIDEIDAVGRHRGAGLGGGHDEREQTLNQLLVEMDGFESNEGVIMMAATNRPDVLDPALLRPGRFDRRIMVPRPDVRGRLGILETHSRKTPLAENVKLNTIARGTPGFSGADLESLVNEAALVAARKDKKALEMEDFEYARDKVMMGIENKSLVVSDSEKRTTAYHEAGHALVARMIPNTDPVHKITIIPRGRALGITSYLPTEDRLTESKPNLEARLAILMGGRVAEEIVFSELTTGAANDLERATELAHKMVCEWGMSKKLGPVTFGKKDQEIFLGRDFASTIDYSQETAQNIDSEIRHLIDGSYKRAEGILTENRKLLETVAEALLEREELDSEEFDLLVAGKTLKPLELAQGGAKGPKDDKSKSKRAKEKSKAKSEREVTPGKLKIEESPA